MGNSCGAVSENTTHQIVITTVDEKESSNVRHLKVFMTLTDQNDKVCPEIEIDEGKHHKMGDQDFFSYEFPELGDIKEISVRRDESGKSRDWYVETIAVNYYTRDPDTNQPNVSQRIFPVNRWVCACDALNLVEFDSVLPQFDKHPEQRGRLLLAKRQLYNFSEKTIGGPPQCEFLPEDEKFSFSYKFSIVSDILKMKLKTGLLDLTSQQFQSLSDIEEIYRKVLPEPKGLQCWRSDEEFGNQKLSGCNPGLIELCMEIPEHMDVSIEHLQTLLEGRTVEEVIQQKKLYEIDLRFLSGIECTEGQKLPGPTCLLYVKNSGDLVPIAIQIMPEPASDNPVFYPTDPEYTWLIAKMWFNLADCSLHQSTTHLGFTHMLMESVAVATNRQLSGSHPIYRLLAPHFLYLIAIDFLALDELTQPGGFVDKSMTIGRTGMFNIIKERWAVWNIKEDGNLPNNLLKRGVDDVDALPNYHYRDDAVLLWAAIRRYVTTVVEGVYDTTEKLKNDTEIQSWIKELTEDAHFKGLPSEITSTEEITEILTTFIFTSSVGHAAVNFGQYDEYGFPPNYPAVLNTEPPKSKDALSEEDVVKALANKQQAFDIMTITYALSRLGTNSLGDFEIKYAWDPTSIAAQKRLKADLEEVRATIETRNASRKMKYTILDPKYVPNAISI